MFAEVIINNNAKALNKVFDYQIPEEFEKKIHIGSRVFVPFGFSKKFEDGFVINIKEKSDQEKQKLPVSLVSEAFYHVHDPREAFLYRMPGFFHVVNLPVAADQRDRHGRPPDRVEKQRQRHRQAAADSDGIGAENQYQGCDKRNAASDVSPGVALG